MSKLLKINISITVTLLLVLISVIIGIKIYSNKNINKSEQINNIYKNTNSELIVDYDNGISNNLGVISSKIDFLVDNDKNLLLLKDGEEPLNIGSLLKSRNKYIKELSINELGELIFAFSDNETLNVGNVLEEELITYKIEVSV